MRVLLRCGVDLMDKALMARALFRGESVSHVICRGEIIGSRRGGGFLCDSGFMHVARVHYNMDIIIRRHIQPHTVLEALLQSPV